MKSRLASVRAAGGLDRVNRAVQLLEDEWQRHGEVPLEEFWTRERSRDGGDSVDAVELLGELVKADMRCRFARGETPTVAAYLARFPQLRAADSRVLSLVYEEYCLNEECGTAPDLESFCNRYADWKSSLVSQLEYHHLLSQAAGRRPSLPRFPEEGQDFEEFRLQTLLGKGGMSRVFLAEDLSLGGKQVVLKVTIDRGQEPKVQGPLDHPHIVPVYSVVYHPEGQLCGLSMPYRPGMTLDELIPLVNPASRPRKAVALWDALVRGTRASTKRFDQVETESCRSPDLLFASPRGDGWDGFPLRGTYAQGVAWIVMVLARALHYAHRRQTFHRDVKPGNLLLTLQNGPQLLDFNLAESPHSANHASAALHGGTLPYMAPEQIEAFLNPELWGKVGARADVYSLGLVLRELLTGEKPESPDPRLPSARAMRTVLDRRPFLDTTVRRFNPAIPPSLEAIVGRCLTRSPADRYPDAQVLEQDLDRFLKHLPLQKWANPSPRERLGNWLIRNRRALGAAACTIIVAASLFGIWLVRPAAPRRRQHLESSRSFLKAIDDIKHGDFARAVSPLKDLEKQDSQNCLVKFYLSLAQNELSLAHNDDVKSQYAADAYLRQALALSDAAAEFAIWSKQHSEVITYLVDFADSRINRADTLADKHDNGNPVLDPQRDDEYRRPSYELAREALSVAATLDPASLKIQRLLARTERLFGAYDLAYRRLSNLIALSKSPQTLDPESLTHCRKLRVWVAFLWAERELNEGTSVTEETWNRLQEAKSDLDLCDLFMVARPEHDLKKQVRNEYHALHDRVRTTVTLAAVELKLSRIKEAEKTLHHAEIVLSRLIGFIASLHLEREVPETDDLKTRIADLKKDLKLAQVQVPVRREPANDDTRREPSDTDMASDGA